MHCIQHSLRRILLEDQCLVDVAPTHDDSRPRLNTSEAVRLNMCMIDEVKL